MQKRKKRAGDLLKSFQEKKRKVLQDARKEVESLGLEIDSIAKV